MSSNFFSIYYFGSPKIIGQDPSLCMGMSIYSLLGEDEDGDEIKT